MRTFIQVFGFDLAAKVLTGVFGILLIRHLPASAFADYTYATSLASIAAGLLTASFNRIYIVGYESLEIRENTSSFLSVQFIFIAIIMAVTIPFWNQSPALYWAIMGMIIANCLLVFATTYMQQEQRFFVFSLIKLLHGVMLVAGLAGLLMLIPLAEAWQPLALRSVVMALVFAVFVGWRLDWRGMLKVTPAARTIQRVIRQGFGGLFVYQALLAVFANVNILMLRRLVEDHDLATFGSAYRYYFLLVMASSSLKSVFLPQVQKATSKADLMKLFSTHKRMVAIYVLVVVLAIVLAPHLIPIIDKGKYPGAPLIFRILCLSAIISFVFSPFMTLLIKHKRFGVLIKMIGSAVLLNIVMSYGLITWLGINGAAMATLISYGYFQTCTFVFARRYLDGEKPPEVES